MLRLKIGLLSFLLLPTILQAQDELTPAIMQHDDDVNIAVFDAQNRYVGTASDDNTAVIWDPKNLSNDSSGVFSPNKLATVRHIGSVNDISFAGQFVATASDDNTGKVWNLEERFVNAFGIITLEYVAQLKNRDEANVRVIRFSPSETLIATGSINNLATLFDMENLSVLTADANFGWYEDDYIYIGNNPNGDEHSPYDNIPEPSVMARMWHTGDIIDIAFSQTDPWIATLATDNTVKIWDYSELKRSNLGREVPVLVAMVRLGGSVNILSNELLFLANDDQLIVSHGDQASIFNLRKITRNSENTPVPELVAIASSPERVRSIRICENDKVRRLGTASRSTTDNSQGTVTIWDLKQISRTDNDIPEPLQVSSYQPEGVDHITFDNTCDFIMTALRPTSTIELRDLRNITMTEDNSTVPELLATMPHGGRIRSIRVSPDNTQLLAAANDNRGRLWDISSYVNSSEASTTISMASLLLMLGLSELM